MNVAPQTLTWQEMEEEENYRRAQAEKRIRALPANEVQAAMDLETDRREQYDLSHPIRRTNTPTSAQTATSTATRKAAPALSPP